ncbi:hypothetical protein GCM10023185_46110 [Hymenobacter saemangeumensis]|uniref:Uncharacterized protein n=1 Tax=Hymenobacter saemangeumensis TaxID=1084522 RepID=A0ABP8ITE1_9BACT
MSYPLVHISNSTAYAASGKVYYASAFCSDDDYSVAANGGTWTANSRGVCLVTEVSATVYVNGQPVGASPYTSSGTSYSQFAIIQTSPGSFAVTRVTTEVEKVDVGELQPEPVEMQK